jgi:hypothetical protein
MRDYVFIYKLFELVYLYIHQYPYSIPRVEFRWDYAPPPHFARNRSRQQVLFYFNGTLFPF